MAAKIVSGAVGKQTDDVVFISAAVRQAVQNLYRQRTQAREVINNLQNRGRRKDKHGNPWRVYELNHAALCNADLPSELRG